MAKLQVTLTVDGKVVSFLIDTGATPFPLPSFSGQLLLADVSFGIDGTITRPLRTLLLFFSYKITYFSMPS